MRILRRVQVCLVCGKEPPAAVVLAVFFRGRRHVFCSHACRMTFKREPERWAPEAPPPIVRPAPALRTTPFVVRMAPVSLRLAGPADGPERDS